MLPKGGRGTLKGHSKVTSLREPPPPLLGFNNNVRHKGRVFHIQTEDSGVKHARVVTHLFADGGRIIKTARIEYAEHVGSADMAKTVRQMMKEQHKGMFIALRGGELDELVIQICGPFPEATPVPNEIRVAPVVAAPDAAESEAVEATPPYESGPMPVADAEPASIAASGAEPEPLSAAAGDDRPRQRSLSNPNLRKVTPSMPPPSAEAFDLDVNALRPAADARGGARGARSVTPRPAEAAAGRGRYAAPRPPAIFAEAVPARSQSIFGGDVISEKSLDEVILSYLAEDLEDGPEKHD